MDVKTAITEILNSEFCGDLFLEQNEAKIKEKYREYAKLIHPDVCSDKCATEAFEKLSKLYSKALENIGSGIWEESKTLWIHGESKGIKYLDEHHFELGKRYTTNDKIIYVFDPGREKYFKQYLNSSTWFKYPDPRMEKEFQSILPQHIQHKFTTIYISKSSLEYPMDLFVKAYKDKLTGRDIAWMTSRMCNLLCFLHYNNIVHNGIKLDNLFINPDAHTIHLYGGWWYTVGIDKKMIGTSKDIYDIMPSTAKTLNLASPMTDIESVKLMFRKIIEGNKDIPDSIRRWINSGSTDMPVMEFRRWDDALHEAYGKREFKVFDSDPKDIYK